jgi:pantoate--beta-alanine ligase
VRELERDHPPNTTESPAAVETSGELVDAAIDRLTIVGAGRVGRSLAGALEAAGVHVELAGRDGLSQGAEAILLCVPDAEIESAGRRVAAAGARVVGHTSGALGLDALTAARETGAEAFCLHPLQTFPGPETPVATSPCAISASSDDALAFARALAERMGMRPFELDDSLRPAYHAAASIASNFLVTLEQAATGLLERTGLEDGRELLAPLVLRTASNWASDGAGALTGPIARGDEATVEGHVEAIGRLDPGLLGAYEAMAELTRRVAGNRARATTATAGEGARVIRTKAELRAVLEPLRRQGKTIGLVPTMGCLHEGHLSLLRAARAANDVVVMTLFVNPTQFGPGEDLDAYPRDEERDVALASAEGADVVYAPSPGEVYPKGFATAVEVGELAEVLCGAPEARGASHFRGVTTVVAKLLNSAQPDVAYFGQKDAQQAIVIRRMAEDLDLPVRIEVLPTVREPDGLALSSRNAYLSPGERKRAAAIPSALSQVSRAIRDGSATDAALAAGYEALAGAGIEPEYLELRDAEDLSAAGELNGRPLLLAVAAQVGRARLIDNLTIEPRNMTGPAEASDAHRKGN